MPGDKQPPLVSVLMTSYNREKYIAEAIESVLASTYTSLELIITDDCSRDKTVNIASSYAAKDKRIKVYINERNLGDYPNRNRAASLASGKYIKYVDADDKIYSDTLELMVNAMESHPTAALALSARQNENFDKALQLLKPADAYYDHFYVTGFLENGPVSAIIRRDIFNEVGGFSGKRMIGDVELWLKIAARHAVLRLPKGLVFWREHGDQEFHKGALIYLTEGFKMYVAALRDKNCPLPYSQCVAIIQQRKKRSLIQLYKYAVKTGNVPGFLRMYKAIKNIDG